MIRIAALVFQIALLCALRTSDGASEASASTAPSTTQPLVSVSVNGRGVGGLRRGWPVIVEGVATGTDEIRLSVVDAQAKPVEWPLTRTTDAPADASGFRTVYWVMDGEKSSSLSDGTFGISVQLRHGDDVIAESAPAEVKLVTAPATAGGDVPDELRMLRVQMNALTDRKADAEREVGEWVQQHPKSVQAQTARGDIAFAAGRLEEAKQAYDLAMTAILQPSTATTRRIVEPPAELVARQNAVLRAMVQRSIDNKSPTTRPAPKS
jgi:hypothetical protein